MIYKVSRVFVFLVILANLSSSFVKKTKHGDKLFGSLEDRIGKEGSNWMCFLLFGLCPLPSEIESVKPGVGLTPILEWSRLEFEYSSPEERQRDIESGFFIPGIPAAIDTDVYYLANQRSRIFLTIPRFQLGTPATLGEVIVDSYSGNHLIRPFPAWSWHRNPRQCSSNRLISVYRIQIDKCNRMWVLDTGVYGDELICPPQILAFDLQTKTVVHRYELPRNQYESRSIFVTPIVDIRGSCADAFVYAADCQTYSIVVYDAAQGESWRITDKTMYPYPNFGTYSILGDTFDLMDGVLGMSITPYIPGRDRKLFFHAMSSDTENWVYTSQLRNNNTSPNDFKVYKGRRSSQSAAEAIDRNGIMYFGVMSDVTMNCWDTTSEYGHQNIRVIDDNKTTLQFASGVKVIDNQKGEQELFVLTSRFQKIGAGTANPNETNFRILVRKIDPQLTQKCKSSSGFHSLHQPPNFIGGGYGLRPKPPTSSFV